MAKLVIKDLADSVELDVRAMGAIYGGSKKPQQLAGRRVSSMRREQGLLFVRGKSRR